MKSAGAAISYNIVISIAKSIDCANDCTLLKENGRKSEFSMTCFQSLFKRIGLVKRKETIAKALISSGFVKTISFTFYQIIKYIFDTFDIPIINICKLKKDLNK